MRIIELYYMNMWYTKDRLDMITPTEAKRRNQLRITGWTIKSCGISLCDVHPSSSIQRYCTTSKAQKRENKNLNNIMESYKKRIGEFGTTNGRSTASWLLLPDKCFLFFLKKR